MQAPSYTHSLWGKYCQKTYKLILQPELSYVTWIETQKAGSDTNFDFSWKGYTLWLSLCS